MRRPAPSISQAYIPPDVIPYNRDITAVILVSRGYEPRRSVIAVIEWKLPSSDRLYFSELIQS